MKVLPDCAKPLMIELDMRIQHARKWLLCRLLATLLLAAAIEASAQAHPLALNKATLTLLDHSVVMVLTLPANAFPNLALDDDGDGQVSLAELRMHQAQLENAVRSGIQVFDGQGALPLETIALSFEGPDAERAQTTLAIVAQWRTRQPLKPERWRIDLWAKGESAIDALIMRSDGSPDNGQQQSVIFSPERPEQNLFPSAKSVLVDYFGLGALHILQGPDHLLFLLVVVFAQLSWGALLLTLSAFTLGHACTLALTALYAWSLAPAVAEPAIALTIVIMALYDARARQLGLAVASWQRVALVFFCALIHGLGFSSALKALGLSGNHVWTSLLGFNLGIEAIQVLIAGAAVLLVAQARRRNRPETLLYLRRLWLGVAIGLASLWFMQRLPSVA
jgi:hypothetical protein